MGISVFWSPAFLRSRTVLWLLIAVNAAGTAYGYEWYGEQLIDTAEHMPHWLLPFVPDSPTASLFFTISLLFLAWRREERDKRPVLDFAQGFIGAMAVVTSIKYGIWAVVMIVAGAIRGQPVEWDSWMLSISHGAMAVEAVLYGRFFRIRFAPLVLTAVWSFANDFVDYRIGVHPYLTRLLDGDLPWIQRFTVHLSFIGAGVASVMALMRRRARTNEV